MSTPPKRTVRFRAESNARLWSKRAGGLVAGDAGSQFTCAVAVDAANASLEYHAISAASMGTPQFIGGGSPSCVFYFTWNGLPGLQCSGLYVPAYNMRRVIALLGARPLREAIRV